MPEKGSVVLATAGRDAGGLYVVLRRALAQAAHRYNDTDPE